MSDKELEEGLALRLDFGKLRKIASGQADVIPAVAQDALTGEVLILGYVNELALQTADVLVVRQARCGLFYPERHDIDGEFFAGQFVRRRLALGATPPGAGRHFVGTDVDIRGREDGHDLVQHILGKSQAA